ncbi:aspartate transaminase [Frateuria aurantia]|uniref:Aminotransferase n=1 Tax=Frateuria aurantia (strain ATCC 33424 / DSM 6220 / KCTC 2777 / LMG 1558 / NBRC 3245 / NCIMB 13370) TaxID=767434 RepID=H8KYH9_FRAAD|nr:aspartate transaminase [Frateuria aurantia]AFC86979.1 aspartate/tyrosine/aromatic aminotransferase [Frateuria aurantia DSM 6220]
MSLRLAARVQRIKPSPSSAAADRAAALRREGRSIIGLVVGEPDLDMPGHIVEAIVEAARQGQTRYTQNAGTPELRAAISAKLQRENGLDYAADQILVTPGAKSAIFNALLATLGEGDEVLVPAPYWVSYPDMVLACDGTPVTVIGHESDGFKLRPEALAQAITPRTRWLILNSPSNPTGAVYSEAEWKDLLEVLQAHPQVWLMTDEIYEHICFAGHKPRHPLVLEPGLKERTLIVNGVSKTYAMTGLRLGYAAGPPALIQAMAALQSQSTSNACSLSQAGAVAALNGDQSFVVRNAELYRCRRDEVVGRINAIDGLRCELPDGAFYVYVNCAGLLGRQTPKGQILGNDDDVVMYLLEQVGVAVIAGHAYGLSPYFRLSTAASLETLIEGCVRMATAVSLLRTPA